MKLRRLELKDVPFMLSWMHDTSVVEHLNVDFKSKTNADCEEFIKNSWTDDSNIHLAVTNEKDEYLGTVSLKDITDVTAEFAITLKSESMGKGIASFAMKEILRIGFSDLGLTTIYWYVSPNNKRAMRFYEKNGFHTTSPELIFKEGISQQCQKYIWYHITQEDWWKDLSE